MNNITTTRECYDLVLNLFNEHEVEFVIIRAFAFYQIKWIQILI